MGYFTAEKLHSFKKIFFTAFRVEIYFLSLNRYVYGMIAIKFEIKSVFPFKKSFNSNTVSYTHLTLPTNREV